ncbi:uncharacterized protein LOC134787697 [Penaeus indicus]|uniref:uncharacterized protein LOC134787697 n=1 Tax=Penaeus indicus TaxID=29960 RepID=UPI00300C6E3B
MYIINHPLIDSSLALSSGSITDRRNSFTLKMQEFNPNHYYLLVSGAPVSVKGDLEMVDNKTIDGVDVSVLEREVVDLTSDQFIEGEVRIDGKLTVDGDLSISGKLNGWNVTSDLLMLDYTVPHTDTLTFTEKIAAESVTLSSTNLLLESLNGLDLEEAATDIVLANESATISGPLDFGGTVTVDQLHVTGTVDGVDVGDLATRSLKKEALQPQLVEGKITVDGAVHFNYVPNLQEVNNKSWSDHLSKVIPLNYDGAISGTKRIDQPVFVLGDFNPTTVNGINLAELAPRILTKSGNQSITGNYTFSSNITATNIDAPVIDEVHTSDLLLLDQNGFLEGTIVFEENVVMSSVMSGTGLLDGCDILGVLKENVIADSILAGASEINVQRFLETLVRKSSDQDITGNTTFSGDVQINDLWAETIDGVYVDELYEIAVQDNQNTVSISV